MARRTRRRQLRWRWDSSTICVGCLLVLLAVRRLAAGESPPAQESPSVPAPPTIKADETGAGFDFQTEEIEGTIRLEGAYHGVTRLVERRTGRQVIDSRYSALNLFKLMSVNLAMGQPRTMPRTIETGTSWGQARWAATDSHRAEVVARYEIRPPNAIDLSVTVKSRGTYAGYELFLSNYFDKALRPHVYLQPARGKPAAGEAERVLPMVNDAFRGTVLVFPRDAHAARRCVDGRWDRSEQDTPTVQMCPVRRYAHCLAVMADPDNSLCVVLMSRPQDCYAVSTRYHADADEDRLTTYSAFDLSLFGDDLLPGDERTVKVRLAVVPLDADWQTPLRLYRAFLNEQVPDPVPIPTNRLQETPR